MVLGYQLVSQLKNLTKKPISLACYPWFVNKNPVEPAEVRTSPAENWDLIWVWVNTYKYTFSGMNIHKSQL